MLNTIASTTAVVAECNAPFNGAELVASTLATLNPLTYHERALAADYAYVERAEHNGRLTLKNQFIEISGRGELRAVIIQSPKIHIVNQFFYPLPQCQLPLFVAEFVVLGNRPMVAIVDALNLMPCVRTQASVDAAFAAASATYPTLQNASDPQPWYQECRSGNDFFVRPKDSSQLAMMVAVQQHVWQSIVALLQQPLQYSNADTTTHAAYMDAYKTHHKRHLPGLRLLERSFGPIWTEHYLSHYLFR